MLFCTAGISSRMGVAFRIFLIFVNIEIVCSTTPSSRSPKSTSSERKSQINPGSRYNPFDITTDNNRTKDANSACHSECLAVKADIRKSFNANKSSKPIKLLYNICGKATGGRTAAYGCFCETPTPLDHQRRIPALLCRTALQIIRRRFTSAETTALTNGSRGSILRKQTNVHKAERGAEIGEVKMFRFSKEDSQEGTSSSRTANPRSQSEERLSQPSPIRVGLGVIPGVLLSPPSPGSPVCSPPPRYPGPSPADPRSSKESTNIRTSSSTANTGRSRGLSAVARPFAPANEPSVAVSAPPPPLPSWEEMDWNTAPDGQPEGPFLVTDVAIDGQIVRALIDTGAAVTMIHPDFAGAVRPIEAAFSVYDINNQEHKIELETTIDVEVRRGMTVPVTGFVTLHSPGLVIGVDFFYTHLSNIWIPEGIMQISVGERKVTMIVKPRRLMRTTMMHPGPDIFKPLEILICLNGQPTRMVIDTCSAVTIVNPNLVANQPLHPINEQQLAIGADATKFLGVADIKIEIGHNCVFHRALVSRFTTRYSILAGTDFIRWYVELIDFKARSMILQFSEQSGTSRAARQILIFKEH